jgi:hypothetical protein
MARSYSSSVRGEVLELAQCYCGGLEGLVGLERR